MKTVSGRLRQSGAPYSYAGLWRRDMTSRDDDDKVTSSWRRYTSCVVRARCSADELAYTAVVVHACQLLLVAVNDRRPGLPRRATGPPRRSRVVSLDRCPYSTVLWRWQPTPVPSSPVLQSVLPSARSSVHPIRSVLP